MSKFLPMFLMALAFVTLDPTVYAQAETQNLNGNKIAKTDQTIQTAEGCDSSVDGSCPNEEEGGIFRSS